MESTHENLRIIVVDNGSTDGSVERISKKYPNVEQIHNAENLGFAGGYNIGMQYAVKSGADYIILDIGLTKDELKLEAIMTLEYLFCEDYS